MYKVHSLDEDPIDENEYKQYLKVLKTASIQYYNGYHCEVGDWLEMSKAIEYFTIIKGQLKKQLIKEGKL